MASELPFDEAEQALARLDKLLSEKPEKVGYDFSEAMKHLTAFREGVVRRAREGDDACAAGFAALNGVINAVYAGHFPLGPVPWEVGAIRARRLRRAAAGTSRSLRPTARRRASRKAPKSRFDCARTRASAPIGYGLSGTQRPRMISRGSTPLIGSPVCSSVIVPSRETRKLHPERLRPIIMRGMPPSHWCTAPG